MHIILLGIESEALLCVALRVDSGYGSGNATTTVQVDPLIHVEVMLTFNIYWYGESSEAHFLYGSRYHIIKDIGHKRSRWLYYRSII